MAFVDSPGSERPKEAKIKRILSGMRPTGKMHLGQLLRGPVQLDAPPGRLSVLLLRGRLARPDHGIRDPRGHQRLHPGNGHGLAERGPRSRKIHHLRAVGHPGARRTLPGLRHVHPGALAGAQPHLQGPDKAAGPQGPGHPRLFGLPGAPGRGHPDVQGGRGARGGGPGAPRGDDPGDRPALQPPVPANLSRNRRPS